MKAINLALHDALAADPSVFLMGEDIADPEARTTFGPSAEIAAQICQELFGELAAPIQRVGAPITPVPASRPLEAGFMPGPAQIEAAIRQTLS